MTKEKKINSGFIFTIISSIVLVIVILLSLLTFVGANKVTVKFNANGGDEVTTQQVRKNSYLEEPETQRKGYDIDGWFHNGKKWNFAANKVKEDMILNAEWDLHEYTINIDYDGGEAKNATSYTVLDEVNLAPATKMGSTFIGYKDSEGNIFDKISKGTTGDINLTAEYNLNNYSLYITCLTKYGIVTGAGEYTYGTEVNLGIELNGSYALENWTDKYTREIVSTDTSFTYTMPARNVNLIVNLVQESFTITYVDELGTTNTNPTTWMTANDLELINLEHQYYDFVGWYDESGNKVTTLNEDTTDNVTLTARWENKSYDVDVIYDDKLVTLQGAGLYKWGSEVTLNATCLEHATVARWQDGVTLDNYATNTNTVTFTMPKENVVIRLYLNFDTYTVTYIDGYINNNLIEIPYYENYVLKDPYWEHHTFLGWYDENDNKVTSLCNSTETNITLTAKWEAVKYTLTIVKENENLVVGGSGTYDALTKVQLSVDDSSLPVNEMFAGWYDEQGNVISVDRDYCFEIEQNVTLVCKTALGKYSYVSVGTNSKSIKTYNSDATLYETYNYQYDANNREIFREYERPSDNIRYVDINNYDNFGNLVYHSYDSYRNSSKNYYYDETYTFDSSNRIIKFVGTGTYSHNQETVEYTYNTDGTLNKKVRVCEGKTTTYTYTYRSEDGIDYVEEYNGSYTSTTKTWYEGDLKYITTLVDNPTPYECYYVSVYNPNGVEIALYAYYYETNEENTCTSQFVRTLNDKGQIIYETGYAAVFYDTYWYYNSSDLITKYVNIIDIGYGGGDTYEHTYYDSSNRVVRETYLWHVPKTSYQESFIRVSQMIYTY